ncbi:MAG: radical SAM protein [bacterium]
MAEQKRVKISWYGKHFGEEPPLVGNKNQGAGGIFFTGCNLRCVFCQNYQISQENIFQKECSVEELAYIMLELQAKNAVNVDLVSPTIWFKQIKEAIIIAKNNGLSIPIVWNSNAYEGEFLLKQMEGLVDMYLPDLKYGDDEIAFKYSGIRKYGRIAEKAIREMFRQVGVLKEKNGIAKKGLIVRHLVLPNNMTNSLRALEIIAGISKDIHLSLLNQYYPLYRAKDFPEINQVVKKEEFKKLHNFAFELGLEKGWVQTEENGEAFIPDFTKLKPFD